MPITEGSPRALFSVYDKSGAVYLADFLTKQGYSILSTGGTEAELKRNDIPVTSVSQFTGFPEIFDGRVKTLHPKIEGGILRIRDDATHRQEAVDNRIEDIDIVVCNLYPFENSPSIENIDIGGSTMIRAAAKNHKDVLVVCDPSDYLEVTKAIRNNGNDESFRKRMAIKAFGLSARYEAAIATWMASQ